MIIVVGIFGVSDLF